MNHLHNQSESSPENISLQQDIKSLQCDSKLLQNEVKVLKEQIKELADLIRGNGSKMNQHIDFVENVYTSVRHPLNFVKTKIESMIGRGQHADLPALTDSTCPVLSSAHS